MKLLRVLALVLLSVRPGLGGSSVTHAWSPARASWGLASGSGTYVADVLECTAWVPTVGITNATQLAWWTTAGGAGVFCGLALYDTAGTTRLATSGALDCSTAGAKLATGLGAFSVSAGTKYNICTCASAGFTGYLGATNSSALSDWQNVLSVGQLRNGANACMGGMPPTTTGVLSPVSQRAIIALFGTNSP